jgi:hypothetical protein
MPASKQIFINHDAADHFGNRPVANSGRFSKDGKTAQIASRL